MKFFCRFPVVLMVLALAGCAVFRPSISDRFPGGYSRLIHAAPECSKPVSADRAGCMTAAEIYEQIDPRRATAIFIRYWEETVFGSAEWMGSKSKEIQAAQRIVIPALGFIYDAAPGDYTAALRTELNAVLLDSLISLDSFREAHSRASALHKE